MADCAQPQPSSAPGSFKPSSGALLVHPRQSKNPVMKHVQNVVIEYTSIVPDFIAGDATAILFLSVAYHQRNKVDPTLLV
jgi:hypothetical protein